MPGLPGGKAKQKRNANILVNAVARWAEGERKTLWLEAVQRAGVKRRIHEGGDVKDLAKELEQRRTEVLGFVESFFFFFCTNRSNAPLPSAVGEPVVGTIATN